MLENETEDQSRWLWETGGRGESSSQRELWTIRKINRRVFFCQKKGTKENKRENRREQIKKE
ncbi:Uncharacterized protein APZ42_021880 [Daphnia magna]|uniref:Uncharacterized protein n=1 Tax=Daphnia magna TaxID=35525 RepID=A0A164W9C6_9CRUS|nr:Uncharacterized protein APZ42_021880 [Daphnia magna]